MMNIKAKINFLKLIVILVILYPLGYIEASEPERDEVICGNIDIRSDVSVERIRKLSNCSRIDGYLRIVLIEKETRDRLDNLSFPKLTEITDFLLIYRVRRVTTLKNWFPNLKYIRGRNLFEGNAIIVRDLPDLVHLGLHRLRHIKGGVRIEDTNSLCFDQTPDFGIIAEAIKSSTSEVRYQTKTQLLPNFTFSSEYPNEMRAKWNYTNTINNQTIDHFFVKLIEFEDLEVYYKNVLKYECNHMKPSTDPIVSCDLTEPKNFVFGRVDNYWPKDMSMDRESETVLNHIQNQVFRIGRYLDSKIRSKSEMKTLFDERIYHIVGTINAPIGSNVGAIRWDDVKPFRHYYVIMYACNNQDNCFVVAHQKLMTPPLENGDDIPEESVTFDVNESEASVNLKWSEPERPNGKVVSYQILLRESNNMKNEQVLCANHWKYNKSNGFVINGLNYNTEYVFRLRAVSLNGPSKRWSRDHNFTVGRISESFGKVKWFMISFGSLLVFIIVFISFRIKYRRDCKSQIKTLYVNTEFVVKSTPHEMWAPK